MPIIRYPVGDNAVWIEPGRKLRIIGRAEEGARVGPVTVYYDDMRLVLEKAFQKKQRSSVFSSFGSPHGLISSPAVSSPVQDQTPMKPSHGPKS